MQGAEIKAAILNAGLRIWQVADKFGCAESTFSKKLRYEFSADDTEKVLSIIKELKG